MWTFGAGGLSPCDALSLHEHTSHATRLRKTHLLAHGLGGSRRSWDTISPALAQAREMIILELPGHGQAHAQADSGTFEGAGEEPRRLARQREPYRGRHGRQLLGRPACARDGAARSRRLSHRPGPGRLLARVGADVFRDHHNGIDYTGTGFATGASRPYAKCHRPDCIHAAAFRKILNARSRFRLE